MKALVKFDKGRRGMAVQDLPVPEPGDGEIRIRIAACGICGSDIHAMNDERRDMKLPVVLGHEFVGTVDKICGDSYNLKIGDWVTGIPACYNCEKCWLCRQGEVTMCPEHQSVGVARNGAMAEYMVMPSKYAFKIPDHAPDKLIYAAAEPLACAVRGIYERIDVKPGDVAVVSGPGTIGLFLTQVLKTKDAYVIVSGLPADAHRLKTALEVGADKVVDNYADLEKAVLEKNSRGADITVDASGSPRSLDACFNILRIHGTHLQVGLYGKRIECDFEKIYQKELYVTATNSTAISTWKTTLDLLEQHKVNMEPLVKTRYSLEDWEKGFDEAISKKAYKVLLIP